MSAAQLFAVVNEPRDTVFLTILARNKAHMLPYYLQCIDKIDYDKRLITVYINTNNNSDDTEEVLLEWAEKHKDEYNHILFETHEVEELAQENTLPHEWTTQRLRVLGAIRNRSLDIAEAFECDYYFVVDCDNFITPITLKHLILQRKPIIAPMLMSIPFIGNDYSNFFCSVDKNGYYAYDESYWDIWKRDIVGTFEVPLVHCTYLIDRNYINKLTYDDGSNQHEFVIFARSARRNCVGQYICNEHDFGTLFHFPYDINQEQEKEEIDIYFANLSS
jgi:hypothetical protein